MSWQADIFAAREVARKQKLDQQRAKDDLSHLKNLKDLPAPFRAKVHRSDLAACRRQDRNQLIVGLVGIAILAAALVLGSMWSPRHGFNNPKDDRQKPVPAQSPQD